jgi:hypothetical protein
MDENAVSENCGSKQGPKHGSFVPFKIIKNLFRSAEPVERNSYNGSEKCKGRSDTFFEKVADEVIFDGPLSLDEEEPLSQLTDATVSVFEDCEEENATDNESQEIIALGMASGIGHRYAYSKHKSLEKEHALGQFRFGMRASSISDFHAEEECFGAELDSEPAAQSEPLSQESSSSFFPSPPPAM